jgi:PAS domain S-box-containing protein
MQKELRKTGNDVIGGVPWATHFCQFYQTKQDLFDILVPYFKAGLESNEFCMWITAEPLGVEVAKEAMARALPDFDRYLAKGQIEIMPHTDWYLKEGVFESQRVLNGWVEKLEKALASGYAGLRLTGNTFWLEKKDWKSFADYEAAVNSVIGKYNMLALCTYCLDRCSAIEIIDVIRNHEFALIKREGKWELIESSIYKQTKEALEASETRLAHLASFPELNPMPVIELDMAGNIRYMNPATKRLFPDMSAMGSEHPFLANWEALSNTLRSEEPQSLTREINIGGSCYEQSVTYVPLTHSLIFRGLDITERKQTEEALEESQHDLNRAQAVARIGSWRLDIHRNELLWSDETYRLFGIPKGTPMTYEKFLAAVHAEDRQYVDQKWTAALRGEDYDIEHRIVVGNEVKWVREKAELEFEQGVLKGGFGTAQDITERKRAEEALRQTRDYLNNLLDYANAPIIVWDPQFRITRFNRAFERLTGLRASEVLGRQLDILFPEDSRAESLDHIAEAVAGERWETVEIPILRQDGTVRTVLWNSATLYGADGKTAVATIAQGQDITERKQADEQLKQRTLELEAANKELESFSYSVSHDLRAPLRSMDGFSQALLEDYSDKLDDEGRDYLKRIQDSASNMAQLIDDMLELSRLTRVSMRRESVNLSELAESITAELKKAQPKRHVEVSIAPGLVAYGDAKLLRVVLENLLDNAWKFTAKIPQARIEGGITKHDGREAYFVRDNGAGFDMAYADKLFVPFQRLHRITEFPGTGIGLATVKRLIHRHGGEVWAEGEVGKGATFYFTLP